MMSYDSYIGKKTKYLTSAVTNCRIELISISKESIESRKSVFRSFFIHFDDKTQNYWKTFFMVIG